MSSSSNTHPHNARSTLVNAAESGDFALDSSGQESVNGIMPTTQYTTSPLPAVDPFAALTQSFTPKRAVSYLRVSTREQAERGGREEGFSIPAQRDANKKKAQSIGAMVVKEFVERGVSGTSTNRPALQEMLRYFEEEQGNVDYVIVHKLDRLARNRADDVALNQRFNEYGIRLISTSENIDQTPGGMLLHGIMSSIAEFYSSNLANEVIKGMNEKVKNGGSVSRAPIGYLNTRTIENGRENRTVTVDEQRSPLITWAFNAYATGEHSVRTVTAEIVRRGLTTVPTPMLAEKPVEIRHVHSILTNAYYTGITTFKGAEYPGSHTPLIDKETFEKVQTILKEKINGERSIKHDHYLKSSLYCGHCGFRMVVQVVKNRHGETYPYYSCLGRHSKRTDCTLRSIQIDHVEDLIQDLYNRISLTDDFRQDLEQLLRHGLKTLRANTDAEREQLEATKQAIERRQRKLLEAHYNDAIGIDMLRTEQKRLDTELIATTRSLSTLNADLTEADELIGIALDISEYAGNTYRQAPEHIRRMLNQLLFDKLLVTVDGNEQHHLNATYATPFDIIYSADTRALVTEARLASAGVTPATIGETKEPAETGGLFLNLLSTNLIALVEGSSKSIMVDPRRFELLTSSMRTRRATNCAKGPQCVATLSLSRAPPSHPGPSGARFPGGSGGPAAPRAERSQAGTRISPRRRRGGGATRRQCRWCRRSVRR
jgi:site-specific DNA recombinase